MTLKIHQSGDLLVDRYEIDKYLDEGGMQQVYRTKDLSFDRMVALKVPKNQSAEKRFVRSARVSARINHPNIAKTLDFFDHDGRNYLIEELLEGEDLGRSLQERFEFLDPHLAAHVTHHIARGLVAAHHANVVHRDLKPSNIMVSRDPSLTFIKITDFGIAKMAAEEIAEGVKDNASITASQTVLGALPYMAPEMVDEPATAGQPADIWAVGALLYRLLSGKFPFGIGLKAVPRIMAAELPRKPAILNAKGQFVALSDALWAIVTACLQKSPDSRPSAGNLLEMCSSLCYSDQGRELGTIETFKPRSGSWGFVRSSSGESIFFHSDSYYGEKPEVGDRVNFARFNGTPSPRAFPVLPVR